MDPSGGALARGAVFVSLATLAAAAGCHGGSSPRSAASPPGDRSVVVYSSADKEFAELVFKAYEEKTGVRVLPLYDTEETKTAGLTARLVAEKEHPRADVFWSSDTSRAVALVDQQIAAPYASPQAEAIPAQYRSPAALWTGFAARIRVFLYNTGQVTEAEAPRSLLDLALPRWRGRFAIANPHFGTTSFQVAALFVKWGDAKASAFLQSLEANGAVIAAGNADVKDRVSDGRVAVGILDEDDAVVALREKKPVALVIPDQEGPGALGTPLMPNAALLVRGAPHAEEARRFIDFLVSAEAERILAASDASQYPLHPGIEGPALLPALDRVRVMVVDYTEVARKLPAMDAAVKTTFGL
jgi:iron(III) transport system substrate-binding protein